MIRFIFSNEEIGFRITIREENNMKAKPKKKGKKGC